MLNKFLPVLILISLIIGLNNISFSNSSGFNNVSEVYGTWYTEKLDMIVVVTPTKISVINRIKGTTRYQKPIETNAPLKLSKDKVYISCSFKNTSQKNIALMFSNYRGMSFAFKEEDTGIFRKVIKAKSLENAKQQIIHSSEFSSILKKEKTNLKSLIQDYEFRIADISRSIESDEDYKNYYQKLLEERIQSDFHNLKTPNHFYYGSSVLEGSDSPYGGLTISLDFPVIFSVDNKALYTFKLTGSKENEPIYTHNEDGTTTVTYRCYVKDYNDLFDIIVTYKDPSLILNIQAPKYPEIEKKFGHHLLQNDLYFSIQLANESIIAHKKEIDRLNQLITEYKKLIAE